MDLISIEEVRKIMRDANEGPFSVLNKLGNIAQIQAARIAELEAERDELMRENAELNAGWMKMAFPDHE